MKEQISNQANGFAMLFVGLLLLLGGIAVFIFAIANEAPLFLAIGLPSIVIGIIVLTGLFVIEPNEAIVLLLFGEYKGTAIAEGLRWGNPFFTKKKISLRTRNFDSQKLKVNDKKGNPIEVSSVVVWRVKDTFAATFKVENYNEFVHIQAESALRHIASVYSYDTSEGETISLRSSIDEVSHELLKEVQTKVADSGVEIQDVRINHLAYAPEIAHAMLQRQQAEAIIEARQKIVEGAVGMVEMALTRLNEHQIVQLDDERKAAMVSNLMVVLCSERSTQPVVNTGTLYQ